MFHRVGLTRPETLWKDFVIERKTEATSARGRTADSYATGAPVYMHAVLCGATPEQVERYRQTGHPVSHVISHAGKPKAKAGDRLILGASAYYVQGVDDPGEQGIWTLYYCEERKDAHYADQTG